MYSYYKFSSCFSILVEMWQSTKKALLKFNYFSLNAPFCFITLATTIGLVHTCARTHTRLCTCVHTYKLRPVCSRLVPPIQMTAAVSPCGKSTLLSTAGWDFETSGTPFMIETSGKISLHPFSSYWFATCRFMPETIAKWSPWASLGGDLPLRSQLPGGAQPSA